MSAHSDVHVVVVLTIVDRAREALRACLPEPLRDQTFNTLLKVGESWHHPLQRKLTCTGFRATWSPNDALRLF